MQPFGFLPMQGSYGSGSYNSLIDGTATNSFDGTIAVTVDRNGDVVAVGLRNTGSGSDFTVIKLRGEDDGDF